MKLGIGQHVCPLCKNAVTVDNRGRFTYHHVQNYLLSDHERPVKCENSGASVTITMLGEQAKNGGE